MQGDLVGCYELIDEDGRELVELPVVGLTDVLEGDPRRLTVINTETGEAHPFGERIPWIPEQELIPVCVCHVPRPIEAEAGWLAEVWTIGQDAGYIGTFPVLAWEPADRTSPELLPNGEAIVLVTDENEYAEAGPVSTRLLPGAARYRRLDEPPFGPFPIPGSSEFGAER